MIIDNIVIWYDNVFVLGRKVRRYKRWHSLKINLHCLLRLLRIIKCGAEDSSRMMKSVHVYICLWNKVIMLTISPACLVLHTRVKLHQHKHLQKFWLTLFICYVYDVQCTWSDGRRLKSAGGFVITYRLLEESAEVSFLSRNLVAKNSLDHSKLCMLYVLIHVV